MNAAKPHRTVVHFLYHGYNFFYPASAMCMIVGLLLLNEAMDVRAAELRRLLMLMGVLQVYEFCVIGLAVYLLRRPATVMDGRLLLFLEIPFFVDLVHLNAEVYGADLLVGIGANAAVLVLAMVKVLIVVRALQVRWAPGSWAMLAGSFVSLLAIPGVLAAVSRDETIGAWHIYLAWWAAAAMLALHAAWPVDRRGRARWPDVARLLRGRVIVAVHLSILLHLFTQGWVYRVEFNAAFVAPILLGLAMAWPAAMSRKLAPDQVVRQQYWMIGFALLGSTVAGAELYREPLHIAGATLSPMRLALITAAIILTFAAWRRSAIGHAAVAAIALLLALLGHTVSAMAVNLVQLMRMVTQMMSGIVPRTRSAWGVIALAAAFALLLAGAMVSLLRARPRPRNTGGKMMA